jgi:hypothetical protein
MSPVDAAGISSLEGSLESRVLPQDPDARATAELSDLLIRLRLRTA